jgi:hypothetical protein
MLSEPEALLPSAAGPERDARAVVRGLAAFLAARAAEL